MSNQSMRFFNFSIFIIYLKNVFRLFFQNLFSCIGLVLTSSLIKVWFKHILANIQGVSLNVKQTVESYLNL